eukprot:scaffold11783_cov120-Cylindrotheca_fusiformis.AAC.8
MSKKYLKPRTDSSTTELRTPRTKLGVAKLKILMIVSFSANLNLHLRLKASEVVAILAATSAMNAVVCPRRNIIVATFLTSTILDTEVDVSSFEIKLDGLAYDMLKTSVDDVLHQLPKQDSIGAL